MGALPAPDGAIDEASVRAVSATATEVMREVVMPSTVGGASNRPETADQQLANQTLSVR